MRAQYEVRSSCAEREQVFWELRDRPERPNPGAHPETLSTASPVRSFRSDYVFRTTESSPPIASHSSELSWAALASYPGHKCQSNGWLCTLEPDFPASNCWKLPEA